MATKIIRQPSVAGIFYPDKSEELESLINSYIDAATISLPEDILPLGGVVPHAGYSFSGKIAAYLYKAIANLLPKRVILIGPSHYHHFKQCSIYNGGAFRTPFGIIEVDAAYSRCLSAHHNIVMDDMGHGREHSLEVQLPFLQHIFYHDFPIVPIAMGNQYPETIDQLVDALCDCWENGQIVLASSDLSHYYSYEKAIVMDTTFTELLCAKDLPGLWDALKQHRIEACGFGPIMVLLELGNRLTSAGVDALKYANSGDITEEKSHVVGYLSALIYERD